jgi:hypothetical protein
MLSTYDTFSTTKTAHQTGAGLGMPAVWAMASAARTGTFTVRATIVDAHRDIHALAARGAG